MLDTRNGFEVDCGKFENAIDWRIGKFTEFPPAVQAHREALLGGADCLMAMDEGSFAF